MHSLHDLVITAICLFFAASGVCASPISALNTVHHSLRDGGSSFWIPQVYNPAFTGAIASGPAAYAKALSKHNVSLTSDLAGAVYAIMNGGISTSSEDTVAATPLAFDCEYLCPVQIGSPPQTLFLDFDTGSSDLWVFSSQTVSSEVSGQILYNPDQSTTAKLLNNLTWSIGYADGSGSSGDVYIDTVSVGDITVTKQAVESAEMVSSELTANSASSGLLGLGFDSINTVKPKQNTFFSNAKSSLLFPVFTANLKKGAAGNYNFGFIDETEFNGIISYIPVNSTKGLWQFYSSGFAVGDGMFHNLSLKAIADTGTTLLLMPNTIVRTYYAQVEDAAYDSTQGGYVFPCAASLPSFTFGIGSYRGVIPGSYMNLAPVDANSTTCYGGLQSSAGIGFAVFGDVLLKSQFVVFDVGNMRLGWASKLL